MNELSKLRPVLPIQAGNVVSVDVGEIGFNRGCPIFFCEASVAKSNISEIVLVPSCQSPPAIRRDPAATGYSCPDHAGSRRRDRVGVRFQEVVHSALAEEAEVPKAKLSGPSMR